MNLRASEPSSHAEQPVTQSQPVAVGGRYELLSELGGGGMAVVFLVHDSVTGRRLALKRPRPRAQIEQRRQIGELFAREFHTLAELAHPRIVEVFDYAIDEQGPFYTMELLDGGDLQQLVPADYRRVCAIARDACSGLSLLHSRRIVHRDISARNIRCTTDGTAKLIDFGAMAAMGPNKQLVGTPAYCAPEVLNLQPLDARADLYALGATLYYALTGHHAYPVREFASLPSAWRFGVTRPSELKPGIPEALDALVLDLLQLDPDNRPSCAAEVMERLAAIEGRSVVEQLPVAQAYLTTPAFVGREDDLARMRTRTMRAMRNRGSAVLVEAAPGAGRSRFLDSCVLSGKLLGATVLRGDADNAADGDYSAMRALVQQLHRALPEATHKAAGENLGVLLHVCPELDPGAAPLEFSDPSELRPRLQAALRQLFLRIAAHHPLLIAVDDLHRVDEPSAAAVALLGQSVKHASVLIVASRDTSLPPAAGSALKLYQECASGLELHPLSRAEVATLLGSVFGVSPELEALAQRAFSVSQGNPREVLRLAQHLVDRGVVRYRAGAWSVPSRIDAHDLPESLAQMLVARSQTLTDEARELGCAFMLCPERPFTFEECASLAGTLDRARTVRDLEQLTKVDVVRHAGERYSASDRALGRCLLEALAPEARANLHLRIAKLFEARGHEEFRVAQHLLQGGEQDRAVELLAAHAVASQALTNNNPEEFYKLVRSLPENCLKTYDEAISLCISRRKPPRHLYALRSRVSGLAAVIGVRENYHTPLLVAQLRAACGLDDWEALDTLEGMPRVIEALKRNQARYDAMTEDERALEPLLALKALARAMITVIGPYVQLLDAPRLRTLPSLSPFAVLSPALGVVNDLVRGVLARITGRADHAREIYAALLERTGAPDRAGMDPSHHRYMRVLVMNGLAMMEASMGLTESPLAWAETIQADLLFKSNGVLVRMLHQLWQGNCGEAERLKAEYDALRIESTAKQAFESSYLLWQVTAHAAMDDLTRLKRTLDEIELAGSDHSGWQPVAAYARAEHQRVRGEPEAAIALLREQLAHTQAGEHQLWVNLAGALVRSLDDAGRPEEATAIGQQYLEAAQRADLGFNIIYVRLPLAVAQARVGHPDAVKNADCVIAELQRLGSGGLNLGLAYEARARVALALLERADYEHYSKLCEATFGPAGNPALFAKCRKLKREAQKRQLVPAETPIESAAARSVAGAFLKSKLHTCVDAHARAELALRLLADHSGATDGVLYRATDHGPVMVASCGTFEPTPALDAIVREYIASETRGQEHTTGSELDTHRRTQWSTFGEASYRPVLLSHQASTGYAITGIAVFSVGPDQPFSYPAETAAELSRLAAEAGDATALTVEG